MGVDVQFHVARLEGLRSDRTSFESQWEQVAEHLYPAQRNTFLSRGFMTPGLKNTENMFDATAAFAAQRFSAVLESLSTPQGSIWHRLVPSDKTLKRNRQVRQYLDDLNEMLFAYRYAPRANFVGQMQSVYNSIAGYGNGIVFVDAQEDQPGLRYKGIPLAEAYFVENHQGVVDTMYRVFKLTPGQVLNMFGDGTPPDVAALAAQPGSRDNSQNRPEILHVVTPRSDYDPRRVDGEGMPWQSCYIYMQMKSVLRESGYHTFPYGVSRYTQQLGEIYGRGPAQLLLPSIKLLNEQKKTHIKQGHRAVDPVLLAYDDGSIATFSMRAGALNVGGVNADGRALIHPLPVGNVQLGEKNMEIERTLINDGFLLTLFQILVDTPQMTATEVLERAREKGMLIAPTAGRQQAELFGPMIEREIDVLGQQRLLPRPPPALLDSGGGYTIEYDSPMSRLQRAEKSAGFVRALDMASNYAKMTNDPAPLDWFNFDAAMPDILDINGAPVAWTETLEMVTSKRQQRAQQAQQAQMLQAAPALAAGAKILPQLAQGGAAG